MKPRKQKVMYRYYLLDEAGLFVREYTTRGQANQARKLFAPKGSIKRVTITVED